MCADCVEVVFSPQLELFCCVFWSDSVLDAVSGLIETSISAVGTGSSGYSKRTSVYVYFCFRIRNEVLGDDVLYSVRVAIDQTAHAGLSCRGADARR